MAETPTLALGTQHEPRQDQHPAAMEEGTVNSKRPRAPGEAATVKDVAALAGVSPMTVSRTLGGGKNVRPELQKRVRDAVSALGYRRNEAARTLRSRSTRLIGVAITNLANPYYGAFAAGVEAAARARGRSIQIGATSEIADRETELVGDFVARQVEGLIIVPAGSDTAHLTELAESGTPFVLASRTIPDFDADAVLVDDIGGSRRATALAIDRGLRRIGFIGPELSLFTSGRRFEGYSRALATAGVEIDESLVSAHSRDVESSRHAAAELLKRDDPPEAIFCATNRNTLGVLETLLEMTDAPHVTLISFDDFELSAMSPVPLIIASHDPRALGRTAADMLLDRIDEVTPRSEPPRTLTLGTDVRAAGRRDSPS